MSYKQRCAAPPLAIFRRAPLTRARTRARALTHRRVACATAPPPVHWVRQAYAAESLTWLEAAVFFLFAMCEYPSEASEWSPLALSRWESYLASAPAIDADGEATRALLAARQAARAAYGGSGIGS
jgi:hypothetical protein